MNFEISSRSLKHCRIFNNQENLCIRWAQTSGPPGETPAGPRAMEDDAKRRKKEKKESASGLGSPGVGRRLGAACRGLLLQGGEEIVQVS